MDISLLDKIYSCVCKNPNITPPLDKVFDAFNLTPIESLHVVVIGQDPYPQINVATGLAFANKKDSIKISPSLKVIKDSFEREFALNKHDNEHFYFDITLNSWAKQGVLLLNSALTTEINKPGEHYLLWRGFMVSFLERLSNIGYPLAFVLLGEQAKDVSIKINKKYNWVFYDNHPSYYARNNEDFSCSVFNEINKLLYSYYNLKINWYEQR